MVKFGKAKKKAKKSKKTSKDTDWEFEGGAGFTELPDEPADHRRRRLNTQERDEKHRRSRRKQFDRKLKTDFAKKMSKRIKFSDILADDNDADAVPSGEEDISEQKEKSSQASRAASTSKLDRLQLMVIKSLERGRSDENEEDESLPMTKKNTTSATGSGSIGKEGSTGSSSRAGDAATRLIEDFGLIFPSNSASTSSRGANTVADRAIQEDNDSDAEEDAVLRKDDIDFLAQFVGDAASSSSSKYALVRKDILHRSESALYVTKPHQETVQDLSASSEVWSQSSLPLSDLPGLYKLWKSQSQRPVTFSALNRLVLPSLFLYQDALLEGRDLYSNDAMLESALFHSVNHLVKSRAKVVKHNQRLKEKRRDQKLHQAEEEESDALLSPKQKKKQMQKKLKSTPSTLKTGASLQSLDDAVPAAHEDAFRDQGFTRPRLLILCPFRHTARKIVDAVLRILGENTSVSNFEKFQEEFADPDEDEAAEELEFLQQVSEGKQSRKRKERSTGAVQKPADWDAIFKGNADDDFKMGIQVNPGHGKGSGPAKGCYLRLYSDFYISDIVLASPIGLKLAMEKHGGKGGKNDDDREEKLDRDFLSSIEQVLLHQADVMQQQNWEHVDFVLRQLNQRPQVHRAETDYSRVRRYFLEEEAARHRQMILTTAMVTPEILATYREFAHCHCGQMRLKKDFDRLFAVQPRAVSLHEELLRTAPRGSGASLQEVYLPVKQVFQVVPLGTGSSNDNGGSTSGTELVSHAADRRFQFFCTEILAPLLRLQQSHTLIVTPSYVEYVRLRNYLVEKEANAAFLCEYTSESDIGRARSLFFQGRRDILLYSGRAHFFRRFRIRGARSVVFYGLPEYAYFYAEIVNQLSDNNDQQQQQGEQQGQQHRELSSLALVTEFDRMTLERVVGTQKCSQMLESDKQTFVFF